MEHSDLSNSDISNFNKYKNYDTNIDNFQTYLDKYGIAVIPNILNQNEIQDMKNGIWDSLNFLTKKSNYPIKQFDTKSWNTYYDLYPGNDMLVQLYSIGHTQFVWNIRQNPKIVNIFSKLWNCKPTELITSFDALSFHIPPEITNVGYYDGYDWFHMDQSLHRSNFECVQGLVSGYDVNEGDATLSILEGSHIYHQELAKKYNLDTIQTNDFYRLSENDLQFYKSKGCERYNVKMTAGSLVLWDSRLIHCNMKSLKNRSKINFRLVVYICQTPKYLATDDIIQMRIKRFQNLYMSSHCAHRPKFFPKYPNYLNFSIDKFPIPKLTNLGRSLVGYENI